MFRKLISNLPYHPAVLSQVAFYAHRLGQEKSIRKIGFLLTSLVLVIQVFAIIYPSRPSLATSANDLIYGASSKEQVIEAYTHNRDGFGRTDIRAIYDHYGIGLDQISAATYQKIGSEQRPYTSTGRSTSPGPDTFISIDGVQDGGIYQRPLKNWDINHQQNWYDSISGVSKFGFRFWIITDGCGNIVFEQGALPPNINIVKKLSTSSAVNNGDKINYLIQFQNIGPGTASNVRINDTLPKEMSYVSFNSDIDLKLTQNGQILTWQIANSKSILPASNRWYTIDLHLKANNISDAALSCNIASISADSVSLKTTKNASNQTCVNILPPKLFCQNLQIVESPTWNSRKFQTSITAQNGATPKQINYFINNQIVTSIPVAAGASSQFFTYTFPKQGTYNIRADLIATNGTVKSGENCQITLTLTEPATPQPMISTDKAVTNLTQHISDANDTTANPGDELKYTITVSNNGDAPAINLKLDGDYGESINDILEYADLIDQADAHFNNQTNYLSWDAVTIPPNGKIQKSFIVRVKDPLPATPTSASDPLSYDYNMQNIYGRLIVVHLNKPPTKIIEQTVHTLPNTGPGSSVLISAGAIVIVGYFFYRNRLLSREIEIIYHEYSSGGV